MRASLLIAFILLLASPQALAQITRVSGVVLDGDTDEPIPFAKVHFQGTKTAVMTNDSGQFELESYYVSDTLVASFVTYQPATQFIRQGEVNEGLVLRLYASTLGEVQVRPPAVDPAVYIMRKVLVNKPINDREKLDQYSYQVYNKLRLDLNNIDEELRDLFIFKRFSWVFGYMDSLRGKAVLPVILSESMSNYYHQREPEKDVEVLLGSRVTGVESLQLGQFLGDMYQSVNIYDDDIFLFNKDFVSPLSKKGFDHYKYLLLDSMLLDNNWCYQIKFLPRRSGEPTFIGDLWIHDTTYAVKKVDAYISPEANLNFVRQLWVQQEFKQIQPEVWMLVHERSLADFNLMKEGNAIPGFFAHKETTRKDFTVNQALPDSIMNQPDKIVYHDSSDMRRRSYWDTVRHVPFTRADSGVVEMMDSLYNSGIFRVLKNLAYMAYTGFYPLGPIEIGDVHQLYSTNPVEGSRLQMAIRTSNKFSTKVELSAMGAYGFLDHRWKYGLGLRWKLNKKKSRRTMLAAFFREDIEQLGLSADAISIGNSFQSILATRAMSTLTYTTRAGLGLEKDWFQGFTTYTSTELTRYDPPGDAGYWNMEPDGSLAFRNSLTTFEVKGNIKWAPGRSFVSGQFDRTELGTKRPVLNLDYRFGIKGVFGSQNSYQHLEFKLSQKPAIGVLGKLDYQVYAGKVFGAVPYPFLKIHPGNQTFFYQPGSFNLMNLFEFVSDQYAGFSFEHHLNGLVLDRVPGLSRLKLRLIYHVKGVIGTLSDRHNDALVMPGTFQGTGKIPYLEAGIGVGNILDFLRLDYVVRLTHLESPTALPWGLRVGVNFDF